MRYISTTLERIRNDGASPWAYLDLAVFCVAMKVSRSGMNEARVLRLFANNPAQREKWIEKAIKWREMEARFTRAVMQQQRGAAPV